MKILLSLWAINLLTSFATFGQISGMWHSSCYEQPLYDYQISFNGPVKTWTMVKSNGKSRTIQLDTKGNIIADSFTGTTQSFIPDDFKIIKLKKLYEKKYSQNEQLDTLKLFNKCGQLIKYTNPAFTEINTFRKDGQILLHKESRTKTETRVWNSMHHPSPTYSYTQTISILVVYRYDKNGHLEEAAYFHSDPFQNFKMDYIYDSDDNLVETNRYDHYNISVGNMPDHYLDSIICNQIDTTFDIEKYFPNYWSVGSPAVNEWKYNNLGQKTEYTAYGYRKGLSFRATWEYDEKGKVRKEIHYNVYKNCIQRIIDFDESGNVIKEQHFSVDGTLVSHTEITISYY